MQKTGTSALPDAMQWKREGHRVCLAAVISCWGSAPRPAGSFLAVREDGLFAGSVSGGCIEGDVITRAEKVLQTGKPVLEEYGVADAKAWQVGLACGGKITIWLAPLTGSLEQAVAELVDTPPAAGGAGRVLACDLASGDAELIAPDEAENKDARLHYVQEAARQGRSLSEEVAGKAWFFRPFLPALRLMIAGAVHIAEPLAAMAAIAGYRVFVSDPRSSFAKAARFPAGEAIETSEDWPDKTLATLMPDTRTAFAALTHDPKIDDPALVAALNAPCFYVGALGSKKTHTQRLARLRDAGLSEAQLARIHAPIGLPLGGRAPAEIALAILAQMTRSLHQPPDKS